MKKYINNKFIFTYAVGFCLFSFTLILSCKESEKVAAKSGAQLWAENCQRCHNTPDPTTFSNDQWLTLGMHMQTRAQLSNKERDKIVGFMKQFNH